MKKFESRIYRHYENGQLYRHIATAKLEETGQPHCVYMNIKTSEVYVSPKDEFFSTIDNSGTLRFTPVENKRWPSEDEIALAMIDEIEGFLYRMETTSDLVGQPSQETHNDIRLSLAMNKLCNLRDYLKQGINNVLGERKKV